MRYFKKIKTIVEAKTPKQQEDDEIRLKQKELADQEKENATRNRIKPTGDAGDRQDRAPVNPDGSPVSIDDVQDRKPDDSVDNIGGTGSSMWGVGTHGSEKKPGLFNSLMRGAGHIKSIGDVMDKGAAMLPVKNDIYEDESGKLRRFGKITTGHAAGNPYYFEFDHYDPASQQNLVLYGIAHGRRAANAKLQPITLKVKAIVPNNKRDVSPMTAPTDDNVQSNFVSEKSQAVKDAERNKQVNIPKNLWHRPEIQRMIDNYKNLNRITLKVRVGGVYGLMIRKDPGDEDSMQKITRKIPRTHIPKVFLDDDFVAEVERVYSIPQDIPAKQAVAAIGLNAVSTGSLAVSAPRNRAMKHVGETLGIPDKTSKPLGLPQSGETDSQINIKDADWSSQSDGETVEYPDGSRRYASGNSLGKQPGAIATGSKSQNPTGTNQHTKKLAAVTKSVLNYTPSPPTSVKSTVRSPLSLDEQSITNLTQLISGQIDEDNDSDTLGTIIGRAVAKGKKSTSQILSSMKGQIDDAIAAYEKEYGEELDKVTRKEVMQTLNAWTKKVKKKTGILKKIPGKLKSAKNWWTSGLHNNTQAAPNNNIKGDPAGAPYDEPDAVFVGDKYPTTNDTSTASTTSSETESKPDKSTEREPEEPDVDEGMSDEKLERYVTALIDGYTKCTLDKPKPSDMLNGPTEDVVQEADILDALGRMVNDQTRNAFKHFAGYGFWPDFTEQDLNVLFVDTDYGARAMGPRHGFAYRDEKARQEVRDRFKTEAMKIRTELGEYYNVNTWKGATGQLIDLSGHGELIWKNAEIEFFQRPDPKNPPRYWKHSREKYKAPAGLNKYDSVLQYLARDVYTRHRVNILSPSYQFKLKHFKEGIEDDDSSKMYDYEDVDKTGKIRTSTIINRRNRRNPKLPKSIKESLSKIKRICKS